MPVILIATIIAIIGIIVEVMGFMKMLKYHQNPLLGDLEKWKSKYTEENNDHERVFNTTIPYFITRNLDSTVKEQVPFKFRDFWEKEKKNAIKMIVLGIILQGVQIIIVQIQTSLNFG